MTPSSESQKPLSKDDRLRKKDDIARCSKKGKRVHGKHFVLQILSNDLKRSRLALAVSKKIDKRAVYRNRLKRRLRECFRINRQVLKGFYDIVIIARPGSMALSYKEIETELLENLKKF